MTGYHLTTPAKLPPGLKVVSLTLTHLGEPFQWWRVELPNGTILGPGQITPGPAGCGGAGGVGTAGGPRSAAMTERCRHCRRNKTGHGCRGLCRGCHDDPSVRSRYRPIRPTAPGGEPTAAEVEALVAEQMRCLPAWWQSEARREAGG